MTYVLWIIQVLLALIFLFSGGMKLVLPIEEMTAQVPLPGWFVRFIGVAEVLGALGLILPGLFRVRKGLTPLAAVGLAVIMVGAVALTVAADGVAAGGGPPGAGPLDAVYALLPTEQTAHDYRAEQDRQGEAVAAAVRASGVPFVVALSSVGADLS